MKIAVILPGAVPVPAVLGGAVEELTTYILEDNELSNRDIYFEVYTAYDDRLQELNYKKAVFQFLYISKLELFMEKAIKKLARIIKINIPYSVYDFKALWKIIKKKQNYDYILIENNIEIYRNIYQYYNKTAKFIVHLHNSLNQTTKTPEMIHYIVDTADEILCVSSYIKKHVIENTSPKASKCRVLYNCIDKKQFSFDTNFMKEDIKKIKSNNEFIFLFVGRINEEKGLKQLAEAFSYVHDKNTKLLVAGGTWIGEFKKNQYLQSVFDIAEKFKDQICFLGNIQNEDMKYYYRLSDVVVIPSICEEAFGMVALEAAYMKKPIISARSGGIPEILGEDGAVYVEKDNSMVGNMADAMKLLRDNKSFRESISKRAYERVQDNPAFDRKNYYDNFCKYLKEK